MLTGAFIGGVSGGVFSGVEGAVAGAIKNSVTNVTLAGAISGAAGGAAAGATAGGLGAAIYGGDIGQGMLRGAGLGAIGGAAFGAIGGHYGNSWSMGRVAVSGLAGGGVSALAGGSFEDGFVYAASFAFAAYSYNKLFGVPPDGRVATEDADLYREGSPEYYSDPENTSHALFGKAHCTGFLCEGNPKMEWIAKNVPYVNQGSVAHDLIIDLTPKMLRPLMLYPTIPPAVAFTLAGAAAQYSPMTVPITLGMENKRIK